MSAAKSGASLAAHRVDLVDKDDARRALFGLVKQVAHTGSADADKHLHKVRTGNGVERHARLPRYRAGKQRLTGSGRAHQQDALRDARAQRVKLFGVLQKFDDLDQLLLLLVGSGHVGKGHPSAVIQRLRLCLAKGVHLAAAAPGLPHHEHPQQRHAAQQQQGRQQAYQQRGFLRGQVVALEGGVVGLFVLVNVGLDVLIELGDGGQLVIDQLILSFQLQGQGTIVVVDLVLLHLSVSKIVQHLVIFQIGDGLIHRHHGKQQHDEQSKHRQVHDNSF